MTSADNSIAKPTKAPLLSVCIPTFNRAKYLREALDSIRKAAAEYIDQIEIVISDNASGDETQSVIEEFSKSNPATRASRNAVNIGAERNFYQLIERARGKYVWMFGDDDVVEPMACEKVLSLLDSGRDLLLLNYSVWDVALAECVRPVGRRGRFAPGSISADRLLEEHGPHIGFISTVIFRRALFERVSKVEYDSFAEYGFSFLYMVYCGLKRIEGRAEFVAQPLVRNRAENSSGYDWYKYFIEGLARVIRALEEEGYRGGACTAARRCVLREYLIPRLSFESHSGRVPRRRLLKLGVLWYGMEPLYWVIFIPVLLSPAGLLRVIRKVLKRIIGGPQLAAHVGAE